ncbi:MAG: hypothetical protein FWD69_01380 [Polyangiaceae bacterium]|nr:hypothetical protein [Polyangiaceae bacterium]
MSLVNRSLVFTLLAPALILTEGCKEKPEHYTTTVEVHQVQRYGNIAAGRTGTMDLELNFPDCPGTARKFVRANKAFSECAPNIKAGDRLEAELVASYSAERGGYRNEIVRLGTCAVKTDPKDEANYETVQTCTDLEMTGVVVGVRCDRSRSKELLAKCPWFRH